MTERSDGAGDAPAELLAPRSSIDNLDAAIIHMLAERFKLTRRVGLLKAEHALPPSDPGREKRQVERLHRLADEAGLDPAFAEKFLAFVIREEIQHNEEIAREAAGGG